VVGARKPTGSPFVRPLGLNIARSPSRRRRTSVALFFRPTGLAHHRIWWALFRDLRLAVSPFSASGEGRCPNATTRCRDDARQLGIKRLHQAAQNPSQPNVPAPQGTRVPPRTPTAPRGPTCTGGNSPRARPEERSVWDRVCVDRNKKDKHYGTLDSRHIILPCVPPVDTDGPSRRNPNCSWARVFASVDRSPRSLLPCNAPERSRVIAR